MNEPGEFVKVKFGAWVFGLCFLLVFLPLMFYAPTASTYIYSYLLQPTPGTLYSERWDYNFFVTGSIILLIIAPISLFFVVSFPKAKAMRIVHLVIVIILIVWYLSAFIVGCVDWSSANVGTVSNFFNKANDARWCCVYYTLTGSPCPQSPCNPNYLATQLTTDPLFLFQLWYIFVVWVALLMDVIFFLAYIRIGLEAYDDFVEANEVSDNMEQQIATPFLGVKQRMPRSYRPKSSY